VEDSQQRPISVEELARQFDQHMPHGRDIGMVLDERTSDGRTRMRLPARPFLSGDRGMTFFFPGALFSLTDAACSLAVFRGLGRTQVFVARSTSDTSVVADGSPVRRGPGT
jgi:acyl-coenzyme A thioesterase PaaI-like protein